MTEFPETGPLHKFRQQASFDWKLLRKNLDCVESLEYMNEIWQFLEKSPLFHRNVQTESLDEQRRKCHARMNLLWHASPHRPSDSRSKRNWSIAMAHFDGAITIKCYALNEMVPDVILMLGTERHYHFVEKIEQNKIVGAFALTEFSHGSDTKRIGTTATYDSERQGFVLHSPSFETAKCWVAGLGKTCTHAVVWAQLVTPDDKCHGLHAFIVNIRDPQSMQPLPGVTVGDLGEKIGFNGVDNGFVKFTNHLIPRENLLNRLCDVTPDGKYVTPLKNSSKRFGTSLGVLSMGRVNICLLCTAYSSMAVVIAIRYSAVRKQFGPNDSEEWPVIQYQIQQMRLFPHLAATYALETCAFWLNHLMVQFRTNLIAGENRELTAAQGMELHALSSAAKPVFAWAARDAIQDCRESCGGHGYLKASRLGDLRNDNDASCTYEGENNVILQQASNWLLSQRLQVLEGKPISSPFGSIEFLPDFKVILQLKFDCITVEDTMKPDNLLKAFKWLFCYYLEKTANRVQELHMNGEDAFSVRNNSQTFFARTLSLIYAEHTVINIFIERLNDPVWGIGERQVLTRLCSLYAGWLLEKRLADLYAGGFASPESHLDALLREGIIHRCKQLLPDAVSLVDVLAPPDFILNSPLGMADGEIYKHLEEWIYKDKKNFETPSWWKEIFTSKL